MNIINNGKTVLIELETENAKILCDFLGELSPKNLKEITKDIETDSDLIDSITGIMYRKLYNLRLK